MQKKDLPILNYVLLQLILRRLFLPLLFIWLAAIGGASYFLMQTLAGEQQQMLKVMVQKVNQHLEQGERILDAIARVTEVSPRSDLTIFMQSNWEAYRHFDTIYCLDETGKIILMVPSDKKYLGLDMSNLPDFKHNSAPKAVTISHPFISLRTGAPTVYLIRPLMHGGCVVGELSLKTFQDQLEKSGNQNKDQLIFILDQAGTLLAHPLSDLVKQQTNMNSWEIFQIALTHDTTLLYDYEGTLFLGNATQVPKVGWIIVDQIPLAVLLGPYAMTFGITILGMLGLCLALVWNLRKQLRRHVVAPLVQLSQSTNALALGDYPQLSGLPTIPSPFAELDKLMNDFQYMSSTLKIRQSALQESEARYRNLFEKVPTGLFRFTAQGEILDINNAYIQMFGFPAREMLRNLNGFDLFLSQEDRISWQSVLEWNTTDVFETKMRRYDGRIIFVRIKCRVVYDSEQQILYYDGNMDDITKQKEAEEALLQHNDKLEGQVNERTKELALSNFQLSETNVKLTAEIAERIIAEEALKKARDQAQAANAAKSQFLANMSHEIRTPMNGIIGMTELTLLSDINKQQQENLEIIKSSAESLLRIINDILDYSKIEAGKMDLEQRPFTIRSTCHEVIELFKLTANQKRISLRMTVDEAIPKVVIGDSVRLRQVLSNLVGNAVKFTATGEISLTINCTNKQANRLELKAVITDTGIGIPEKKLDKLFKRFSQVDDSNTRQFGGTGLGLAISKKLVEMMNGQIWVESTEFVGSKFYFTAILGLEPNSTVVEPTLSYADKTEKIIKKKVLVVEDDAVSSKIVCTLLRQKGLGIQTARNGNEALSLYAKEPFDLILMDINMPYLDGYSTTALIRDSEKQTLIHVPIIAITAYALSGDREKCLKLGMDDYISKPIDFTVFAKLIDKWLA